MSENLPMLPEHDFLEQAQHNEGFGRNESIIPFTRLLQPLSPQVGSTPGATPGVFFNQATNTVTESMIVIPILHQWNYTEWVSRNDGGGFVRDWGEDEAGWQNMCDFDQRTAYQPMTREGHSILKARHFFILQLQNGINETSILPFAGTALKVARQWSSMMQNAPKIKTSKGMVTPAYFYYQYNVTVEETKNNKGRWFLPKITPVVKDNRYVPVTEIENGLEIWKQAVDFRNSLRAGEVRAESVKVEEEELFLILGAGSCGELLARLFGAKEMNDDRIGMMLKLLVGMDKKLDDLLYEDEVASTPANRVPEYKTEEINNVTQVSDFVTEEVIRQQGQKIPYNKLEGREQLIRFKEFLAYIRLNESKFTPKEFEFASYADKNFSDIRISDNSRRILGTAYQKAFRKPWEFKFVRGYMYKFDNQMAWQWEDGSLE